MGLQARVRHIFSASAALAAAAIAATAAISAPQPAPLGAPAAGTAPPAAGRAGAAPCIQQPGPRPYSTACGPRVRVVVVNDLGGDPDGLVSTAHALLSPSAEVRSIVGTRGNVTSAVAKGKTITDLLGMPNVPVVPGSLDRMVNRTTPVPTPGSQAIIDEANRTGTALRPLYVTVGGGLTDVASALLQDPTIAGKFTVVWIGGAEYPNGGNETNFGIDPIAAQVVFNDFNVPIWQVPRDVYFQTQVSLAEMQLKMAPYGRIGAYLMSQLGGERGPNGESWTLGDNPLVELTALGAWFSPTNHSAVYETRPTPTLEDNGRYTANPNGRPMRLYKTSNTSYFMADFYAKLALKYPR